MAEVDHRLCNNRCAECRWLRSLSDAEFRAWASRKFGRPVCKDNPTHLVGSYNHNRECVLAGGGDQ